MGSIPELQNHSKKEISFHVNGELQIGEDND